MGRPSLEDTQGWVACVVRSGLDEPTEVRRQVVEALREDHPQVDAEATAGAMIAIAGDAWLGDALGWPDITDYDRLQAAFAALDGPGIAVLQGCEDHWSARDRLRDEPGLRGILWFTRPDVWHAISEVMLEVNLWHGDTANAAPGDQLLDDVIAAFGAAGLEAHFDEGRIEVSAYWQRRPGTR